MLYNVMLVSSIQQGESAICIYILSDQISQSPILNAYTSKITSYM